MTKITAWTDSDGIVQHITPDRSPPPGKGLIPRVWSAPAVALGWRWSDLTQGFVPPEPVPQSVSMRQARLALLAVGLEDDVEEMMGGLVGLEGRAAQIEWEYATEIRRNSPMLAMLAPMLGLTPDDLDNLFRKAAAL